MTLKAEIRYVNEGDDSTEMRSYEEKQWNPVRWYRHFVWMFKIACKNLVSLRVLSDMHTYSTHLYE